MTSHYQKYRDLLSLTQSFLLTEFKSGHRLFSEPETYEYFKQHQPKLAPKKEQIIPRTESRPPLRNFEREKPTVTPCPPQQKQQISHPSTPSQAPKPEEKKSETNSQENVSASSNNRRFQLRLEPVTEVKETEISSIKTDFIKQFPERQLLDQPPEDSVAKKVGEQWKQTPATPEVVILSFQENHERQVFLQNMKTAINQHLAPCVIYSAHTIENKKAWDKLFNMKGLRLIITQDYGMYSMAGLMCHYRESPEDSKRYLGGVPILLLTDISLYIKQPQLKFALWRAICTMLPKTPQQ